MVVLKGMQWDEPLAERMAVMKEDCLAANLAMRLVELLDCSLAGLMESLLVDWKAALWADLKDPQLAWKTAVVWVVWMVEWMACWMAGLLADMLVVSWVV
jgi:hypothetical protein